MIQEILDKAPSLKILVVGDFIEDRYFIGDVDRISPEAPVPVVKVTNIRSSAGGAGNVMMNLLGLGVDAHFFGDIGPTKEYPPYDEFRWKIDRMVHCVKTRVMSGGHHIVRMDEDINPYSRMYLEMKWRDDFEAQLIDTDCVVLSDYHKSVISDDVAESVIRNCRSRGIPVVVDAKKDYYKFIDATIIKCNGKEWASQDCRSAKDFIERYSVENLIITHGDCGMEINRLAYFGEVAHKHVSPHVVPIVDVCGAGDTVTAIIAIGAAIQRKITEDISIDSVDAANRLAAEVCRHPGVYPIQRSDLEKILSEPQPI